MTRTSPKYPRSWYIGTFLVTDEGPTDMPNARLLIRTPEAVSADRTTGYHPFGRMLKRAPSDLARSQDHHRSWHTRADWL